MCVAAGPSLITSARPATALGLHLGTSHLHLSTIASSSTSTASRATNHRRACARPVAAQCASYSGKENLTSLPVSFLYTVAKVSTLYSTLGASLGSR